MFRPREPRRSTRLSHLDVPCEVRALTIENTELCGANMFADCPNFTKVTFAEGMKYFKAESPFRHTPIAELDIPQTLTELEGFSITRP